MHDFLYSETKETHLTLFPITVLGPGKAGKTALVSSFVQNYFPTVYTATQEQQLYYKTIDLVDVRCPRGLENGASHKLREERAEANFTCMKCGERIDDGMAARIGDRVECRNKGQLRWSRGKVTAVKGSSITAVLDDEKVPRDFGEWQHVEDDESFTSRRQAVWRCLGEEHHANQGQPPCGVLCRECWLSEREEQVFPAFVEIADLPAWDSDKLKLKNHYLHYCKDPQGNKGNVVKYSSRFQESQQQEKVEQDKQSSVWPFNSAAEKKEAHHVFLSGFGAPNDRRSKEALRVGDIVKARNPSKPDGMQWQHGEVISAKPLKVRVVDEQDEKHIEEKEFEEAQVLRESPLAAGRLGFLIAFDCHDKRQLQKAKEIHDSMEKLRQQDEIEPIVFLVATQLDKDVHSLEAESSRNEAKRYVEDWNRGRRLPKSKQIRPWPRLVYEEVSATDFRKVKRVFRRMLALMREIEDEQTATTREQGEQPQGLGYQLSAGLNMLKGTTPRSPGNGQASANQDCSLQ